MLEVALISVSLGQASIHFLKINLKNLDRDYMLKLVRESPHLNKMLKFYFTRELIPEQEYNWITENPRLNKFIENAICYNFVPIKLNFFTDGRVMLQDSWPPPNITPQILPYELTGRERSVVLMDFWLSCSEYPIPERINFVKQIRTIWENRLKIDDKFEWFNKDDPEARRREFLKWLIKTAPQHTDNLPSLQSHDELLSFFDQFSTNLLYGFDLMRRFRNNWNQQQLRARSKGKKQCNFVLSEKTVSKLEKLAAEHHLTRTEIIELIINAEAKHQTYIRERLSRREQLLCALWATD